MTLRLVSHRLILKKIQIPITLSSYNYCKNKTPQNISQDNKKTQSSDESKTKLNELLQSLIDHKPSGKPVKLTKPVRKRIEHESKEKFKTEYDKKVVEAAKNVAKSLGGDTEQTQSELLSKLLKKGSFDDLNVKQLLKDMKVERQEPLSRGKQAKETLKTKNKTVFPTNKFKSEPEKLDLFGGDRLNIFKPIETTKSDSSKLSTWEKLEQREMRLAVTHPPSNYFQQMILWTDQGKVWKFPVDNEQGMEKEQNVCFTEHVFLEPLLSDWCPKQGPIRHFMELVCVGLSKNNYLSADDKRAHIEWYKNYFNEKRELLKEIGAIPTDKVKKTNEKSL